MPFPDICETSISWSSGAEVQRTVFHSQNVRQRYLSQKRDDVFSVTYELTDSELAEFEAFYADEINNGADTFSGPYYDGEERTGTIEILNGEYSYNYIFPGLWNVTYEFEVKDRDLSDAQALYEGIESLESGVGSEQDLYDLMVATAQAVNNNRLLR